MPFGLCNAPGTFQRCMMAIFHDMIKKKMEVFMDDFSVFENSFSTCLTNLENMLKRCEDTKLALNWEKSHFMVKEGIALGHKISKKGIEVNSAKIEIISKLPHTDWELNTSKANFSLIIVLGKHNFVEFPVVNTNSPARYEASRNEFVLIVLYDGHTILLWHTMNGTHPRAVRYGINQSGVKELFYFFFDDVVDFWINPPLRLHFRGVVFFE
nr:reverse transcriptase domain-containing protein [Tanacetum cinerariifolium]